MKASVTLKGSPAGYTLIVRRDGETKVSCLMDKVHALRLAAAYLHRHTRRTA